MEYSYIANPLYELTGPVSVFHWDGAHQKAYETLKEYLVCAPFL